MHVARVFLCFPKAAYSEKQPREDRRKLGEPECASGSLNLE